MAKLYEVKISTYTRVLAESEAQAQAYAEYLLGTVDTEQVEAFGEFQSFGFDDVSVIEDTEEDDA